MWRWHLFNAENNWLLVEISITKTKNANVLRTNFSFTSNKYTHIVFFHSFLVVTAREVIHGNPVEFAYVQIICPCPLFPSTYIHCIPIYDLGSLVVKTNVMQAFSPESCIKNTQIVHAEARKLLQSLLGFLPCPPQFGTYDAVLTFTDSATKIL